MKEQVQLILKTLFTLGITLCIFYIIFKNIDFFSVVGVITNANIIFLFFALILSILTILLFAKRSQIILISLDFPVSFRETLDVIMGVFPFASITPSIASDGLRAFYFKDRIRPSIIIGSVLTERIFDFTILFLFLIIGMTFGNKMQFAGIAIIIFAGIVFVVYLAHAKINLPLKKIWNERIQNIFLSLKILMKNKEIFLIVVGDTLLIWILSMLQILMFFYALEIKIPFFTLLIGAPIAILIGQIPITLGGAGTRDAAFILLFSEFAAPEQLLSIGIFFSFFRIWLPSFVGLFFMKKMMNKNPIKTEINDNTYE